jgi:hypothetical protein
VRLQGVGAESVIINADAHPAGKMEAWRRQVNCLFGLSLQGRPLIGNGVPGDPYDVGSNPYKCPDSMQQRVDRIPMEAIVGWDTTGNGNLAQQLQEPTLMGAYEGAGITVLGRGIRIPANSTDFFGVGDAEAGFPAGYEYLTTADCSSARASSTDGRDYGTSNFLCNPSRIDGLSVINSSQGGGAIFVHGWNHNLEIGNTRIHGNHGTLTGGITVGNGEFPDAFIAGAASDNPPPPGLPASGLLDNEQAGYGFNRNVKVHHNAVTDNLSLGDALYSGTPSAAGGITFCSGADGYLLNYNWVCGNMSSGDAGGVAHSGFINDGTISHNWIMFNQSQNPTIPTNGGGLAVLGAAPDPTVAGLECGSVTDVDCPPGLAEGTGRNLVIDANLLLGNSAESGTGGGLRLQVVNGQDVAALPRNSSRWNDVTVTNNIIANNVAGWDGGGVSMQDALRVRFINNTVVANDTTASAGVLFNTLGAPLSAAPPDGVIDDSTDQPSGLVTMKNTQNLQTAIATASPSVNCPTGYSAGNCQLISLPQLTNNLFYQNRSFHIGLGALGLGQQSQQKVVTLYPTLNQEVIGADGGTGWCAASGTADPGAAAPPNNSAATVYWDLGVRGDPTTTPNSGGNGALSPAYSVLTNAGLYPGANNVAGGSTPGALVIREYCNGSRIPPEQCAGVDPNDTIAQAQCRGYHVPAGHSESTGLYPVFALANIAPSATVDEGNNWINLTYGPLSLSNPSQYVAKNTALTALGDYGLPAGSPAIDKIPFSNTATSPYQLAPTFDFNGVRRKGNGVSTAIDIGAIEFAGGGGGSGLSASVTPSSLSFGTWATGTTSPFQTVTVTNTGTSALAGGAYTFGSATQFSRATALQGGAGSCGATLAVGASCTINVVFHPTAPAGDKSTTLAVAYTGATVTGSPVQLSGTGTGMAVTPASLAFGNVAAGTTSAAATLTVTNATGGTRSLAIAITAPFSRATAAQGGAGSCGATLGNNASCTINVVYTRGAATPSGTVDNGTATITTNGGFTVANSPVTLTGTNAAVGTVSLTPASWSPSATRGCGLFACPVQGFTLTNTGSVPVTVASGVLSGASEFAIVGLLTTCGPGAGQIANITSLSPGASCTITVRFAPPSGDTAGAKAGTLSVSDAAGTQSASLSGTAN